MIEIELMSAKDADALEELDRKCFKVSWSKKAFLDEAENDIAVYFLAKHDGKIIGYIGFWKVYGEADITNIAVAEEFRRQGIASMLIERVIKEANDLALSNINLEVRRSNIAAQSLYTKFGFEVIGNRKHYYSDNREDALIMTLRLTQENV